MVRTLRSVLHGETPVIPQLILWILSGVIPVTLFVVCCAQVFRAFHFSPPQPALRNEPERSTHGAGNVHLALSLLAIVTQNDWHLAENAPLITQFQQDVYHALKTVLIDKRRSM
jgi:hypothetical protein